MNLHDGSGDKKETNNKVMVFMRYSFREICIVTVSLPLVSLLVCFVTAYIFQYDDIHETHCRVYNVIPSISAVTGVSPQRYLWRISVALHTGPRIAIALVSKSFYDRLVTRLTSREPGKSTRGRVLSSLCHWLNCVEIAALCGVTYISNRENYPLHEKIFIVFMVCSLCHMLAEIKLRETLHSVLVSEEDHDISTSVNSNKGQQGDSLRVKKILFYTSIVTTVGLVVFFMKHRLLCHDMAFSWFALCEYVIASANMAFHVTVVKDFPTEQLSVTRGLFLDEIDGGDEGVSKNATTNMCNNDVQTNNGSPKINVRENAKNK